MNCPACDRQLGSGQIRMLRSTPVQPWWSGPPEASVPTVEVCDEWCAYTMRERWAAEANPARTVLGELLAQNPYVVQMAAQLAMQQAGLTSPEWLRRQLGLGPVTFGEKIP